MKESVSFLTMFGLFSIFVVSMTLIAGCTSDEGYELTANSCDKCSDVVTHEKTSVVTIAANAFLYQSADGTRLHVVDKDNIAYNVMPIAKHMDDLDEYDKKDVTFKYVCTKDGYYQITEIDFTSNKCPKSQNCDCVTPTPTPICGCKV